MIVPLLAAGRARDLARIRKSHRSVPLARLLLPAGSRVSMRRYAAISDVAITLSSRYPAKAARSCSRQTRRAVQVPPHRRLCRSHAVARAVTRQCKGHGNSKVAPPVRLFASLQDSTPALSTDPDERPEPFKPVRILPEKRL